MNRYLQIKINLRYNCQRWKLICKKVKMTQKIIGHKLKKKLIHCKIWIRLWMINWFRKKNRLKVLLSHVEHKKTAISFCNRNCRRKKKWLKVCLSRKWRMRKDLSWKWNWEIRRLWNLRTNCRREIVCWRGWARNWTSRWSRFRRRVWKLKDYGRKLRN